MAVGQLGTVKVARPGHEHIYLEHGLQVDQIEGTLLDDGLAHQLCIGLQGITQLLDKGRDVLLA